MTEKEKIYGIAIVGGGASGLFAALCAILKQKESGMNFPILLLEKNDRVGKKLLSTGNGRCNITNRFAEQGGYFSVNAKDIPLQREILAQCPPRRTLEIFRRIGIECFEEEEGRMYPRGEQAAAVLNMLRLFLEQAGVELRCDFRVERILPQKGIFHLYGENNEKTAIARRVILAVGGASAKADDKSYGLIKPLGHTISPVFPSLVQIKTEQSEVKALKGMKCRAEVSVFLGERAVCREKGEVLFTEYGLSGICIFQISRKISEYFALGTMEGRASPRPMVALDLMPESSREDLLQQLRQRKKYLSTLPAESFLEGMLNKKIGQEVMKSVVPELFKRRVDSLTERELQELSQRLKRWVFHPTGTMSWQAAQVTAGGWLLTDFDPHTLESLHAKGLYACGEVLDADGICGGYNLQWAWSSGYLAGTSAALSLSGKNKDGAHGSD